MKNLLLLLLAITLLTNCKEDHDPVQQLVDDTNIIATYLADNGFTAQTTDSGLQYLIEEEGVGDNPVSTSVVKVYYKGYFTNGQIFDVNQSGDPAEFSLLGVIPGWTEGIPKFKSGGKGKLFIPSGLGYGPNGRGSIPGNSVLIFDIDLVSFR